MFIRKPAFLKVIAVSLFLLGCSTTREIFITPDYAFTSQNPESLVIFGNSSEEYFMTFHEVDLERSTFTDNSAQIRDDQRLYPEGYDPNIDEPSGKFMRNTFNTTRVKPGVYALVNTYTVTYEGSKIKYTYKCYQAGAKVHRFEPGKIYLVTSKMPIFVKDKNNPEKFATEPRPHPRFAELKSRLKAYPKITAPVVQPQTISWAEFEGSATNNIFYKNVSCPDGKEMKLITNEQILERRTNRLKNILNNLNTLLKEPNK